MYPLLSDLDLLSTDLAAESMGAPPVAALVVLIDIVSLFDAAGVALACIVSPPWT